MAAVLDGRRLYARREELQEVIEVTDPAASDALADVIRRPSRTAERLTPARATSRRPWPRRRGWQTARSCRDAELARLACALTDPQVRDTLYALAVGEKAAQAEALWAQLSRTLPEPWRVEALVLLAFSAYARGDGPLAGVSLEAALRCDADAPDGGHARHRAAVGDAARTDPRSGDRRAIGLPIGSACSLPPTRVVRPAGRISDVRG